CELGLYFHRDNIAVHPYTHFFGFGAFESGDFFAQLAELVRSGFGQGFVWVLFAILVLPLVGTFVYSIASSWSATILP
ncbi:hypothetical protein Q6294_34620, partial [Klebsiella pneumoniae]|nr:hypothetical protein [Klebsiella pneumoniae]